MAKTGRVVVAVLAGAGVWAVLWIGGNQAALAALPGILVPEQPITHIGALLLLIGYSVVLSLLAGWVTAAVAGAEPMRAVWVLAALQLALGIIAEVSYWPLMPVWYHLVFLALIIPATVYGGKVRAESRRDGLVARA